MTTALKALFESSKGKPLYTALILDRASHSAVQKWFEQVSGEPLLGTVSAHHVTIQFKPTEDQLAATDIGAEASVRVVGWAADDKIQVAVVSGLSVTSGLPHVTVAFASGVPPAYSKQLLQKEFVRVTGPVLSGRVEAVLGK